jgi:hypothetical protein
MPLQAAEYHVAPGVPGAADDNPGTLAKPWKTLAKAAAAARAGDTVLLHAGTYTEFVMIKNAGDADKPIVFKAIADYGRFKKGCAAPKARAIRSDVTW